MNKVRQEEWNTGSVVPQNNNGLCVSTQPLPQGIDL